MSILVSPDPRFLSSGSGLRAVSASLSNRAGSSSDRAPLALAMALAIRSSMGVVDDGDRAIDGFLRISTASCTSQGWPPVGLASVALVPLRPSWELWFPHGAGHLVTSAGDWGGDGRGTSRRVAIFVPPS